MLLLQEEQIQVGIILETNICQSKSKCLSARHWIKGTSHTIFIHSCLNKSIWRSSVLLYPLPVTVMIRPQTCTLRSELRFSALGDVGQGSAQHLSLCLHALLAFFWESLLVCRRELMPVIWRAMDKTKWHFSVYQKWFPPMLNDGSWAWSISPIGTSWKWGSWHKCKGGIGVERIWSGNLRPDIFTYGLYLPCLCPVKRRSKYLRLQLFCLKSLVTKYLYKMVSDSRGEKSKLMASKWHACILWTARKLL